MTLNVNLEDVPDAILEAVMRRIIASRRSMKDQQQLQEKPALQPKPQIRKQGADGRTWKRPEPAAVASPDGLGFLLIPRLPFDVELLGPFGDYADKPEWSDTWGGHGGVRCITKSYTNNLWGTIYAQELVGLPDIPGFELRPLLGFGGYYAPRNTETITQTNNDGSQVTFTRDFGGFAIGHVVAKGVDIRFKRKNQQSETENPLVYTQADDQSIQPLRIPSRSCTFELIIRLGLGPVTSTTGFSGFRLEISAFEPDLNASETIQASLDTAGLRIETRTGVPIIIEGQFGGVDTHYAVTITQNAVNHYVQGVLRYSYTATPSETLIAEAQGFVVAYYQEDSALEDNNDEDDVDNTTFYNGPSVLKGIRYTNRALYRGQSFIPPISLDRPV